MRRVNIIGAGLAGLSAAVTLAERGIESNLISRQPSERAQSVLAEGGINAALNTMGEDDSPQEHFADTMRGGADLADPAAVWRLTERAPEIVRWLWKLGVPFQMEQQRLILRNFGGQKKKRTAYAKSSTGKIVMTALIDEARKWEAAGLIHRFPHHAFAALELNTQGGKKRCTGVRLCDLYTGERLLCPGEVILASGGMNGLFPGMTTGTTQNSGDVTAIAFSQGVELGNPEMIQYHPTTVQIPGKRMLISEAARGEGGRLFVLRNGTPWYFMEERHPELGNLMPRDVISRECVSVCQEADCGDQVFLDLTGLPQEAWEKKLSDLREEILHYLAVDPCREPVPVSPGIHFFMGGLHVDVNHRTNVPGVYAAGECACQYHGANRLGGNSLLGALHGGMVAAETAAESGWSAEEAEPVSLGADISDEIDLEATPACTERLSAILLGGLGIVRCEADLKHAKQALDRLLNAQRSGSLDQARCRLGGAMLEAALQRKESRGAHARSDFPNRDDARFQKTTVVRSTAGKLTVVFHDLPERSASRGDPT